LLEQELAEFFSICALTNEYEIVVFEEILNKCVLAFNKNDDFFLSICNALGVDD
jgi:hypothetical protein